MTTTEAEAPVQAKTPRDTRPVESATARPDPAPSAPPSRPDEPRHEPEAAPATSDAASPPDAKGSVALRKIFAMVGVAILVFLAVSTYQVVKSLESKDSLRNVEQLYFPILLKADSSIAVMEKVSDCGVTPILAPDVFGVMVRAMFRVCEAILLSVATIRMLP